MKSVSLFALLFAVCGVVSANEATDVVATPEMAVVVEEVAVAPVAPVVEEETVVAPVVAGEAVEAVEAPATEEQAS